MEVHHQHKPIRTWREFAKEVGIIVLGVVIALAGEQAVEAIHHHYEVMELDEALNRELSGNVGLAKITIDDTPCVMRRLDDLERWRQSWRQGRPLKLAGPIGEPIYATFRTAVWHNSTSGAILQMPLSRRITYGQFYDGLENSQRFRDAAQADWRDLSQYEVADKLSPDQLLRIYQDINDLRRDYQTLNVTYRIWTSDYAPPLGVRETKIPTGALLAAVGETRQALCKPLLMS